MHTPSTSVHFPRFRRSSDYVAICLPCLTAARPSVQCAAAVGTSVTKRDPGSAACGKLGQWRALACRGPAAAGSKAAAFFRRSHGPTSYLRRRQIWGWCPWRLGRLANGRCSGDVKEAEHPGMTAFSETRWAVATRANATFPLGVRALGNGGIFRPIREAGRLCPWVRLGIWDCRPRWELTLCRFGASAY